MILDFNNILGTASEVNLKYVVAINVLCGRKYKTLYLDQRTIDFQQVKPFAYNNGFYYVCCPCCHLIERVAEHRFEDGIRQKIQCTNRTISEKIKYQIIANNIESTKYRTLGYTLDLTDWKL